MNDCPICDEGGYRWKTGCGECGYVDVDKHMEHEKELARSMERSEEVREREVKRNRW